MDLPKPNDLRIVYYPDPVLRKMCAEVTEFGPELQGFVDRMLQLMAEAEGVGLAAPQVGVLIRLFVCNVTGEPGGEEVFVNPRFLERTGSAEAEEGCLSLTGVLVTIRRATRAVLAAQDPAGNAIEKTGENLQARIWQHETDHLSGRLITDNMSTTDEIANRRALKQLKERYTTPIRYQT